MDFQFVTTRRGHRFIHNDQIIVMALNDPDVGHRLKLVGELFECIDSSCPARAREIEHNMADQEIPHHEDCTGKIQEFQKVWFANLALDGRPFDELRVVMEMLHEPSDFLEDIIRQSIVVSF